MGLVTLTFDLLTLKLVCEFHQKNLPSEFGHARPSSSRVARYVSYATDGRTDGRTDTIKAYCPLLYGRGHNKKQISPNTHLWVRKRKQTFAPNGCDEWINGSNRLVFLRSMQLTRRPSYLTMRSPVTE